MGSQETTAVMLAGFSPCPNDTFMFDALVHGRVSCKGLAFDAIIEDIERLNLRAVTMMGELSLTKLSVAALGRCADRYRVLDAGAALGRGVGPLVVRADGGPVESLGDLVGKRVAVPGENTTANLLVHALGPRGFSPVFMRFDEIMGAVQRGEVDAGVVIHEGRFTYAGLGLELVADLGEVWESQTGLPLPLGVICTHRAVEEELSTRIGVALRASIEHAFAHPDDSWDFVREHSQELSESVCRQHIDLYVNDYSRSLGDEGRKAIEVLLRRGGEAGLFDPDASPW